MANEERTAIIISASSDIGMAISRRWLARGWRVLGTYRTESLALDDLKGAGVELIHCNLCNPESVGDACANARKACPRWDVLVMCPGTQDPIGAFSECDFDEWSASVETNFVSQMRIVHELLPTRNTHSEQTPSVLFFAGGGTNSAPVNYSAYILSKIALIKMCELLDAEILDTSFVIVGPGWVKTKIHGETLRAGEHVVGGNFQRTLDKLASNECTSMSKVLDCLDWAVATPRTVVSGRNFSVVSDEWGTPELARRLSSELDMYKLRRDGNEWKGVE